MNREGYSYKEYCFSLCKEFCEKVLNAVEENIEEEEVFKLLKLQDKNTKKSRMRAIRDFRNLIDRMEECEEYHFEEEEFDSEKERNLHELERELGPGRGNDIGYSNSVFGDKENRHEMLAALYNSLSWPLSTYRDPYVYVAREARNVLSHREIFGTENYKDKFTIILILVWIRANFDLEKLSELDSVMLYSGVKFLDLETKLLIMVYSKKGNPEIGKILEKGSLGYQKILEIKSSTLSEVEWCDDKIKSRAKKCTVYYLHQELKDSRKEIKPEIFLGLFPCYVYDMEKERFSELGEIDKLYAAIFLKLRSAYIKSKN